jgi:hypothetical protein
MKDISFVVLVIRLPISRRLGLSDRKFKLKEILKNRMKLVLKYEMQADDPARVIY